VSADSVVPGNASGGMDGVAFKPLTVDFHETGFVSSLNQENGQPFWFQMSSEQQQKAGSPWGPVNLKRSIDIAMSRIIPCAILIRVGTLFLDQ
jgi:hypothetical protein